jgi:hypothetical protein
MCGGAKVMRHARASFLLGVFLSLALFAALSGLVFALIFFQTTVVHVAVPNVSAPLLNYAKLVQDGRVGALTVCVVEEHHEALPYVELFAQVCGVACQPARCSPLSAHPVCALPHRRPRRYSAAPIAGGH